MVPVYCHNCGHRNPEGVNFCSSCGNALLEDGDDATITLHPDEAETSEDNPEVTYVAVPHGAGVLVVTRGPNVGARYLLGDAVVRAGRHPESDIFLDDVTVSRRHAVIRRIDDGYEITDVGSLNGTYVDGERIDTVPLKDMDEVQIGRFVLVFLLSGRAEATA